MENLYKRLLEFSRAGVYRYSYENSTILYANQGFVEILDLDCQAEDILGKKLKDILIYVEQEASIRVLLDKHNEIHDFEYHFKTLKGDDRWVIHDSFLLKDKNTGEKIVEAIVKDITAHKATEEKLVHVESVLRAINNINQLIVREKNRKRLLQKTCEYLIDIPTYFSAWVALCDDDGNLQEAALAGSGSDSNDFTQELKAAAPTFCFPSTLEQPTVLVIDSCTGCVLSESNKVDSDECLGCLAARLEYGENTYGALVVAVSSDYLTDADEHELLEEIAHDLALALHDLEQEEARQRTEQRLRSERDLAQKYLDVAGTMILVLDVNGTAVLINDRGCEILGCLENDIVGKDWFSHFLPEVQREPVKEVFNLLMAGELEPVEYYENPVLAADGTERLIAWHNALLTDSDGTIIGTVGSGMDITERRQATLALRESEARLHEVTEHAQAWVWEVNAEGLYTYASPAVESILGFKPDELVGRKHFYDLFHPEDREALKEQAFSGFKNNEPFTDFLNRNVARDESTIWLATSGIPILNEEGVLVAYRGSDRNVTSQKMAEDALYESERRYRRITEAITDYIFTVEVEDGLPLETVHGEACVAVTGYTPEEFAENPFLWIAMVPECDRGAVKQQAELLLQGEESPSLEHRIMRKDGAIRWVLNRLVPHYDSDGALLSYDGLIRDITERKGAEKALRESEEKHRLIVENTNEVIMLTRPDGVITYVSPASRTVIGFTPDELEGQQFQIVHPEDLAEVKIAHFMALKGSSASNLEYRILTGSDKIKWVSHSWAPITERGHLIMKVSVLRDITERKITEQRLLDSQKRYRRLFEYTPISLWEEDFSEVKNYLDTLKGSRVTDFKNHLKEHPEVVEKCAQLVRVIDVNKATLDLYQADSKDELVSNLKQVFTEESYHVFTDEIVALSNGETEFFTEAITRTLGGKKRHIALRWNVLPGHEQTYDRVLVSIVDLTDRKRIEEELFKAQKIESIGLFARGVAKDYDNIVNHVLGNLDLARMETKPDDKLFQLLTEIEQWAVRAKDLTNQLLSFSRGGAAQLSSILVRDLLHDAINYALSSSDARCSTTVADDIWPVEIDEGQIMQVLTNLITNAEQSLTSGGVITVEAKNIEITKNHLIPLDEGPYVKITIMDHGKGLEADQLTRIFDPYYAPRKKGTHLGLATSYSIIKKLNGYMRVESEIGIGTTFYIYLPASTPPD